MKNGPWTGWVVGLATVMSVGCGTPGAVLKLSAATSPPAYCVALGADGQRRYGARFDNATSPLPQTLGVRADGRTAGSARLNGLGATGLPIASVSIQLMFDGKDVAQRTMALPASCTPLPNAGTIVPHASAPFVGD